jgi:adenosylcobyric acid synthase
VLVRFTALPAELADADLVLLPGSRATVADLAWLRERGLAGVIEERARQGRPLLGVCAGYQMLGTEIDDEVESGAGVVAGLGLLPVRARFERDKTLNTPHGVAGGTPVAGYEIHHGTTTMLSGAAGSGTFPGGCRDGAVFGTSWHGVLENDEFRRSFLTEVAAAAGRDFTPAPDTDFGRIRERRLDALAGLVADHLDTEAVCALIESGPPPGLPAIGPLAKSL